jgi:hypothetical protein
MNTIRKPQFCAKTFQHLSVMDREEITLGVILKRAGGNLQQAAKILGIPVFGLLRRLHAVLRSKQKIVTEPM